MDLTDKYAFTFLYISKYIIYSQIRLTEKAKLEIVMQQTKFSKRNFQFL